MAKATKPFKPVVATANDLRGGEVVFRGASGHWTRDIARAAVADSPAEAEALLALAIRDATLVVDPNLIEIARVGEAIRPVSLRERIRLFGPTLPSDPAHVPV